MTKKENFFKDTDYKAIGEFRNEYGELFVLYTSKYSKNIFITGDEFDWEGGWKYNIESKIAFHLFYLSKKEVSEIKKII